MRRTEEYILRDLPQATGRADILFLGKDAIGEVKIQIRGPDIDTLRGLTSEVEDVFQSVPGTRAIRNDWENAVLKMRVVVDQERARRAGVTSEDVAGSLSSVFDGVVVTQYRERDKVIPVVLRAESGARESLDRIRSIEVWSTSDQAPVPLVGIADFEVEVEPSRIRRFNQERAVMVSGKHPELTALELYDELQAGLAAIDVPRGYAIEIDGEIKGAQESNEKLFEFAPHALFAILLLLVLQFDSLRRPLIVLLTIPLVIIGANFGLFLFGAYFDFTAMLGLFSHRRRAPAPRALRRRVLVRYGHRDHVRARRRDRTDPRLRARALQPLLQAPRMSSGRLATRLACALTAAILPWAGCVVGPDYEGPPDLTTLATWSGELQGGLTAGELDPETLATWWERLDDPELTALVEAAIAANLDLRTAEAQLRQARAERALTSANRFPTLGSHGEVARQGTLSGGGGSSTELYAGGFDAQWEIDVFGGLRRAVEASEADLQVAEETRRDVLVTVVAEVALNYVELRTFQRRFAAAKRNLALQEETLEIVRSQFENGAATALDLERASANLAATRASLPALEQNVQRSKNRLTTLLGEVPGTRDGQLDSPAEIPVPPLEVAVGVPADVLRRRPDVRAAERRFAAETARVGVATAELYPKFVLRGSVGVESLSPGSVTRPFRVGPEVRYPIFDAGRTRRQIEIQDAVQEQAMLAYEAAVIGALEETQNALTDFALEQERLALLRESTESAARAAELASRRYEAGYSPFLEVLDAQRTVLAVQDDEAASAGAVTSNLVRLYKALGGGWSSLDPAGL
jgi:NodT family efflux transporter outer membrane factor (OMF) lipoprotein